MNPPLKSIIVLIAVILIAGCSDPISKRDSFFKSAEEYLAAGRYEEAVIQFRNALQIDNGHVASYLGLGKVFQQTGDPQQAVTAFQQVLKLDDKNIDARLQLGQYLLATGNSNAERYGQAREMAEEILKLDSSNIDARILLGNAY